MKIRFIAIVAFLILPATMFSCGSPEKYYSVSDFGKIQKIDAHFHYLTPDDRYMKFAISQNFKLLTPIWDGEVSIRDQLRVSAKIKRLFPEDYAFFATFPADSFYISGFADKTIALIKKAIRSGATGVKIWKNIGMVIRDLEGKFVMVDDTVFEPVFRFLEKNHIPVIGHLGEPKDCWMPFEKMTDPSDVAYYKNNPQYHMYMHPDVPSYEKQIQARDNLLRKHPGLDFTGAHLASLEWSVDEIARRLDSFPSLKVDLAARMYHLRYQSNIDYEHVRNFMIKYQDRIIYGTDNEVHDTEGADLPVILENLRRGWLAQWIYLATDSVIGVKGLKLPKEVIDKIYYKNAIQYFHLNPSPEGGNDTITTKSLLDEMVNLDRLAFMPGKGYKSKQYSSYDRRSKKPTEPGWFSNEDGFGGEPIPAFERVLREPDSSGTGEYLICDIQNPGAIVRLWSAGINGNIRLYLDNMKKPVYEGNAQDFFWKTIDCLSTDRNKIHDTDNFRQFDAVYFPIVFSKSCRIEWIGNIKDLHFYHVGVRLYDRGTLVNTFTPKDILGNSDRIKEINRMLTNPDSLQNNFTAVKPNLEYLVPSDSIIELVNISGSKALNLLSVKIRSRNIEQALRRTILSIYFDDSTIPQVQAPAGDFFGAAPGLNQFNSLPFSVLKDSTMICRFVMPFKHNARIEIRNTSDEAIKATVNVKTIDYVWDEGKTMYFMARWKLDRGLTASDTNISDIPYLKINGTGRIVGAAAYIYNPSHVPTSWGNWWGEGDEKIWVDNDTFPSFFGTGSEDYFNYSWSSQKIFSFPYCGQPRNDGPGNRGYVSNFRWHILDDIPFNDQLAFYMELRHHGVVPGFSYGRITYFYALPGLTDDFKQVSPDEIHNLPYQVWKPEAYLGSAGFRFVQAEKLVSANKNTTIEKGKLWAGGKILMWKPLTRGETLTFIITSKRTIGKTNLGFTLENCPDCGSIRLLVNGRAVKIDGKDTLNLATSGYKALENHFSDNVTLVSGLNKIVLKSMSTENGKKTGIDFIWLK